MCVKRVIGSEQFFVLWHKHRLFCDKTLLFCGFSWLYKVLWTHFVYFELWEMMISEHLFMNLSELWFGAVLCAANDKHQTKTKTTSKTKIMLQVQHSFPLEKSESEVQFSVNYNMESYCLCGQPYDPNIFMIQCDACKDWFHSRYVRVEYELIYLSHSLSI